MMFGLPESAINKINEVFFLFPVIEEAVLYGSRAKGNFKLGSDIDLTLKGEEIKLDVLNELTLKLDDLLLPYSIDISVYKNINTPELIEHINRVGISFYKRDILK